jgi:exoribonuclease-2
MDKANDKQHRSRLERIAGRAMVQRGLLPNFSSQVLTELDKLDSTLPLEAKSLADRRETLWCSIDNDDSNDLDQLTAASELSDGDVEIFIAIADVTAKVAKDSAIDDHARHNTTSVYTPGKIFPMLPEKLSTDITSLNCEADRLAVVVSIVLSPEGEEKSTKVVQAVVRSQAKLTYREVGRWLEGQGPMPAKVAAVEGLAKTLELQDNMAQKLAARRHSQGAVDFETMEARPVFEADEIKDLQTEERNRATELIAEFMIAANTVCARFLEANKIPAIRRVVRTPKRWSRIVELAAERNFVLPVEADSKKLNEFLVKEKLADQLRFPDLCLSVVKLLGPGEYIVEMPGEPPVGHFGLAVKNYTHSTAPNRRYPDLITQRLLKAVVAKETIPYGIEELDALAKHCTFAEDAAKKVERQVGKAAAAIVLENRIGQTFEAIVTGAADKGTWVRLLDPPVEGRLMGNTQAVDVGHRIRVQLVHTDVEQGFIDFKKI